MEKNLIHPSMRGFGMLINRRSVRVAFLVAMAAMLNASDCCAALQGTTGSERKLWEEGEYAVVVARVEQIVELSREELLKNHATHSAVLAPMATIAGRLDPSVHRELSVNLNIGPHVSSVSHAPPHGACVLAVIAQESIVVADICTFMPDNSALVVIDGPGDKRVAETLKRIQEARAHPDPDPNENPATRPAKKPGKKKE
jgi:hypothetical protein